MKCFFSAPVTFVLFTTWEIDVYEHRCHKPLHFSSVSLQRTIKVNKLSLFTNKA